MPWIIRDGLQVNILLTFMPVDWKLISPTLCAWSIEVDLLSAGFVIVRADIVSVRVAPN